MTKRKPTPDSNVVEAVLALGALKDDRVIGVMGGALVDYWLGRAIFTRLREMNSAEQELLLESNGHGPLASFFSKIWVGFALNLYDEGARNDLVKIKNIRNLFAHADEHVDFTTDDVVQLCAELSAPKLIAQSQTTRESRVAKERFLDAVHHLTAGFNLYARLSTKRPAGKEFLQY